MTRETPDQFNIQTRLAIIFERGFLSVDSWMREIGKLLQRSENDTTEVTLTLGSPEIRQIETETGVSITPARVEQLNRYLRNWDLELVPDEDPKQSKDPTTITWRLQRFRSR